MILNLEQLYERMHFEIPELSWYDMLMFHDINAKTLNGQFKKIKTPLKLYSGNSASFVLSDVVKQIVIKNNGSEIAIDENSEISEYITALQLADKNSFIVYEFTKNVYGVDRLYFKLNGLVNFKDRVSFDELMKNFCTTKGGEFDGMDGSGSILDRQLSTIYARQGGDVSNNVAKGYTDTGSMGYCGDFAFRDGKLYLVYDFMQSYTSEDDLPIFELTADVYRGVDVLGSPSSYVSGSTSLFIPDNLNALYEAMLMNSACRKYNRDVSFYNAEVQRLSTLAEKNISDESYTTDTRREQVWK